MGQPGYAFRQGASVTAMPHPRTCAGYQLLDCANANTIALGKNTSTMPTYSNHDIFGFSGTVDWQISDNLEIKSITAYRNLDSEFAHDGDSTPFFLSWVRDEIYKQEQFTQEIHLLGTGCQRPPAMDHRRLLFHGRRQQLQPGGFCPRLTLKAAQSSTMRV